MSVNFDILEKAAFACFSNKLEDIFKRLLLISISKLVQTNPNITVNQAYIQLSDKIKVERTDFDSAVMALEHPLEALKANKYKRPDRKVPVIHLNYTGSNTWTGYENSVMEKHPELKLWISE